MRAVVQRVSAAEVEVAGDRIAQLDHGLLALVGVGREDGSRDALDLALIW
ncbi:MAG: D-aminoacyl-tRNA deacylase [Myxococcales bacterium]|nr:hypothetical protein [Myxococcales bacterium]HIK86190.1 hypothetical protein [Myxococcales bacterium]